MLRRGVPIHIWLGAQLPCTSQIDPELLFDERQSSHSERRANRRCAALSRSVQRLKGARLSAMLCRSPFSTGKIAVDLTALSLVSVNNETIMNKSVLYNLYGPRVFFSPAFLPGNWSKNA